MNKIKYFIPSFIVMIIIFCFSHADASTSSSTSDGLLALISSLIHIEIDSFVIRKIAHMSEYALLTLCLFYGFYKTYKKPYFYSLLTSILYACSDEFHQFFIKGRNCSLFDVGIDSIGMFIMLGIIYMYSKKRDLN